MRDRIKAKLSFANVVALLVLFVVLGGGAYAAATIRGSDVVDNSLTGKDVNERTLKGVTRCPKSAANRVANICFSKSFGATDWNTALTKCAARKLRLPTIGEGFLIYRKAGNGETWTDEVVELTPTQQRATVKRTGATVGPFANPTAGPKPYRCITVPTA